MKQEKINKIKELNSKGLEKKEIAEKLKLSIQIIRYYLDEDYRQYRINKSKEYFKNLPRERKKEVQNKNKEYFRNYMNKRYRTDKIFREKHIARVLKNSKKKYQIDKIFREKQLEHSRNQWKNRK